MIDIAGLVAKDKYQPSSVEVASELPAVWLRPKENPSVTSLLEKVRAEHRYKRNFDRMNILLTRARC